jgi:hypothetical protein
VISLDVGVPTNPWQLVDELYGQAETKAFPGAAATSEGFGSSVAISGTGDVVVVGAPGRTVNGNAFAGAVDV